MSAWLDEMFGKSVGFLFILLCLLGLVVGVALIYLIIYGALLTSYKYAECKSMDTLNLADTVKCLMTGGVFYESTFSTEPLYEGEKPTLSLDMRREFFKFCLILRVQGHRNWADDLQAKYNNYQNRKAA